MLKIFKYTIAELPFSKASITVPETFACLQVSIQHKHLVLWAIVDPDPIATRIINLEMYVTGQTIENTTKLNYITTVQDGSYVAHIFERLD